jgi:hypothetical protein
MAEHRALVEQFLVGEVYSVAGNREFSRQLPGAWEPTARIENTDRNTVLNHAPDLPVGPHRSYDQSQILSVPRLPPRLEAEVSELEEAEELATELPRP